MTLELEIIKFLLILMLALALFAIFYGVYQVLYYFVYRYELRKFEREQAVREAERILEE